MDMLRFGVDMPHGEYAATVDMPQRWICRRNKFNRDNFIEFNLIEFKFNLFESLNELKLFCIYLNGKLELKYINFI